ncbi:MAG: hypothetical protein ACK4PK_09150 [Alphaproteobacteria bacterium]|jgi:hypothetical protein
MTDQPSKKFSKNITRAAEDLLIRANVLRDDRQTYAAASFMRERVDYLVDLGDDISGIVLKTGAKIAVRMPYEELERAIYFADQHASPVLDLREKTGGVAAKAVFPDLGRDFTAAAPQPAKTSLEDVPLRIAFFARQPQQQNFQMCVIDEEDIDWKSVDGDANGKNGPFTKFRLVYGQSPFGGKDVQFDMPRPKFMELYNLAKMQGDDTLDLRDWTRRRDPDNTPPPPPGRRSGGPDF